MDYATFSGDLVPRTTPWAIAFRAKPDARVGHGFNSYATIVAKWNMASGVSAWGLTRWGNGLALFLGDGSTNGLASRVYTDDAVFSGTAEREICVAWDGGQTAFNRIKFYWRAVGGTWAAATMLFTVSPPSTLPVSSEVVTIGTPGLLAAQAPSMELRDFRIFSSFVAPSGTSDIPLTTATARWRFRRMSADRMAALDEVAGASMTLTNTSGGSLRPARIVDAWTPTTPYGGKALWFGDSKFADDTNWPSSCRRECANQLAAGYAKNVDFVGQFTDTFAAVDFASNAQHSAFGGSLLSIGILSRCLADVTTYTPDVVVLEGGTNDAIVDSAPAATIRDRMGACIDAVLAASATVRVIVVTDPRISSTTYPAQSAVLVAYNALLPALVASKGGRVRLVDLYQLVSDAGMFDSLHPNSVAHLRIGEELAVAIAGVL